MNDVTYKHPNESREYLVDLAEELPDDSALVEPSLVVTVLDTEGTDVTESVLNSKSISGMQVTLKFMNGSTGEDYRVTTKGVGATSGLSKVHTLELRVRDRLMGNI